MTFASTLVTALCAASLVLADEPAFIQNAGYQQSAYGQYPVQTFVSNPNVTAPIFNVITTPGEGVSNGSHLFVSPRGTAVSNPSPMIVDAGTLSVVWSAEEYGTAFDVKVQQYNGEDYLTFWAGETFRQGYGHGYYYMLNSSYDVVYNLTAVNLTVPGDIHEFLLTPNGTALITIYEPLAWDLTAYGVQGGWLMDSLFQEIDVETNDLIFEWRASDHYNLSEAYLTPGTYLYDGKSAQSAFDFFHINSVEKDDLGNYLISARHTHSISYISGTTGEVLWQLGGKRNNFTDLSSGNATNFAWQHDARWASPSSQQPRIMTLFDNGAADFNQSFPESRGLRLAIDTVNMTAAVETSYNSPQRISSESQGNLQPLPNGNVMVGWGSDPAFTEFSSSGQALWTAQFGLINGKATSSYRVYKQSWTGSPRTNPSIAAGNVTASNGTTTNVGAGGTSDTVYVSWNGATRIASWSFLASNSSDNLTTPDQAWRNVSSNGFETNVTVAGAARYLRAVALDADDAYLGASDIFDLQERRRRPGPRVNWQEEEEEEPTETTGDEASATQSEAAATSSTGAAVSLGAPMGLVVGLVGAVVMF
ncbi:hypothetical protein H2201_002547 [Coniosporium apollinis]|uniref:ASST-domain-containing protein n=2 Tax=Coniosporium TaxID=2810619 RepID=A0ABQ9P039_9PEZI|nr:hypothetical protein H2199_005947 [Cladosporium sp. JES 115]KAJ9667346.1 hypothetical protein H2201_002547 [Coniosporium apollinis]